MDISIVSWIHNCEDTIEELYNRVSTTMETIGSSYEIILVNDHSTDNSWEIIKDIHKRDPHVKAISFSRHYGHSAGLQAGFERAKGDMVFTISPTLENHPEELPKLIEFMKKGEFDMVVGFRKGRYRGREFRKHLSDIASYIISFLIGHQISDVTSPVRLIKKNVLSRMKIYGDHHMFLPALAALYGAKFGEVEIEHIKPKNKSYKTSQLKIPETVLDIIVIKFLLSMSTPPFSTTPIRIFGGAGLISLSLGFLAGVYLSIEKLVLGHDIGNRPMLMLSALLIMLGSLFVVMGLLGELMVRVYFEGQNKMPYHIKEVLNS